MNHKAMCAKSMSCAVLHENGVCEMKKECTCGLELAPPINLIDRIRSGNLRPDELGTSQEKVCSCSCHAVEGIQFCMNCFHKHGKAQEKEIDKEEVEHSEMNCCVCIHKNIIKRSRAADRAALVRAVMGMAFVGITGDREDGYNDALEDVVDLLHSPEKK